jgi:nicotinate-nucleotide pyrophosphorylase (carboxylating)
MIPVQARHDGDLCLSGTTLATVTGLAGPLLTAERTALNLLRHLSGIATLTRRYVDAAGGRLTIADTRKTLPLLRDLEKYAVRVGGGQNGRFALDEGVILKSNHLSVAGGIRAAVRRSRIAAPDTPVQVEVTSVAEADEALAAGAGVLLWSRGPHEELRAVVQRAHSRARVEVSGRITPADLAALASAGADFVSIGAVTESAPAADITFELRSL